MGGVVPRGGHLSPEPKPPDRVGFPRNAELISRGGGTFSTVLRHYVMVPKSKGHLALVVSIEYQDTKTQNSQLINYGM